MGDRRTRRHATALLAALLVGACSIPPLRLPPPPLPPGFELDRALVEPLGLPLAVQLDEAGWNSRDARRGGLAGIGIGLGAGGLACAGSGPLAPLCLVTLVPLTTVVGAVGGAAAGTAHSRAAPGVDDKRALLLREWTALADRAPLVAALQRRWPPPEHGAPPPAWRVQVGYATLRAADGSADAPFAIEASARLVVSRPDDPRVRVERTYRARTEGGMTLAQWRADDAQALRSTLDALAGTLAAQLEADLAPPR